jgi:hypothetical protein
LKSRWWLSAGFLLTLVPTFGLAALAVWGGHAWGVENDCRPQQADGQCGIAIAAGNLFGCFAGGIVAVVGSIVAGRYWRAKWLR